ncbi:hypothetical protein SBOR_5520 [Sclerotinia borealis F-4128]|uniref:Uncharacterized protein n=1 Tax=Sclerotinia borealis (strain F-4128) TaxID=1432307 RepID=W9CHS4_SCLBF|nr:hypothetical protein SBOR_5520 [Sclerotinia borealis F-4128]
MSTTSSPREHKKNTAKYEAPPEQKENVVADDFNQHYYQGLTEARPQFTEPGHKGYYEEGPKKGMYKLPDEYKGALPRNQEDFEQRVEKGGEKSTKQAEEEQIVGESETILDVPDVHDESREFAIKSADAERTIEYGIKAKAAWKKRSRYCKDDEA